MFHHGYAYSPPPPHGRLVFVLLLVIVVAAAIGALVLLLRQRQAPSTQAAPAAPTGGTDAARILDERFARGEIDDDEYVRRRTVLRTTE